MQITAATTFTEIHADFRPSTFGNDKYIRSKEGGDTLYTQSSLKLGGIGADALKRREGKYANGAQKIKDSIDHEHGAGTADRVFKKILDSSGKNLNRGVQRSDLSSIQRAIADDVREVRALAAKVVPGSRAETFLEGAKKFQADVQPRWCKSSVGADGLPQAKSSTDDEGLPADPGAETENDFAKLMRGTIAELPKGSFMNCWEAVLMCCVSSGLKTKEEVLAMYVEGAKSPDKLQGLLNQLGYAEAADVADWEKTPPKPGDIIVIDKVEGGDREIGFHVMIAGEDGQVYSHDKSAKARAIDGRGSPDCMVHTDMEPVMRYADAAIDTQGGTMAVRYLRRLVE